MRAVILGAGASGLLHALCLRAHGVEIEGVYDPDEARARSLAELARARVLSSLAAADASSAEIFAICGPPTVHATHAQRFAAPGRLLFLEKPIAIDEPGLAAVERLDGCVPVLQWRMGRALNAVRGAIRAGELGPRPTVCVDLAWHRSEAYFAAGRGAHATWGCGALLSIGIHAIDAVLWALGDTVRSVGGALASREGVELETEACVVLSTTRGAMIALRLTLDAADDQTRICFSGAGVTATISGTEQDPTASGVAWSSSGSARLARLEGAERDAPGCLDGPLLVPLVAAALGRPPHALTEVPTVRSTAAAHRAVFALAQLADPGFGSSSEIDLAFRSAPGHSVSRACGFLDGPAPPAARLTPNRGRSHR